MDLVSLPFFYNLGHRLHNISRTEATESNRGLFLVDAMFTCDDLDLLLQNYPGLSVCRKSVQRLSDAVEELRIWYLENRQLLDDHPKKAQWTGRQSSLRRVAANCETVLLAELQVLTTFHPAQKGAYSTQLLIDEAEKTLPASILGRP